MYQSLLCAHHNSKPREKLNRQIKIVVRHFVSLPVGGPPTSTYPWGRRRLEVPRGTSRLLLPAKRTELRLPQGSPDRKKNGLFYAQDWFASPLC